MSKVKSKFYRSPMCAVAFHSLVPQGSRHKPLPAPHRSVNIPTLYTYMGPLCPLLV